MKPEDLHARILQAAALTREIDAQGQAITAGAAARLAQVRTGLDALRGAVVTNRRAADRYLQLTREKGALERTLAKS